MTEVTPTEEQIEQAHKLTNPCRVCPRECMVDRPAGETGYCGVGASPLVASAAPHFGEESVLVGAGGSGTIFLSGCNMLCVFCQNSGISHGLEGHPERAVRLVETMRRLAARGCENFNFVTPSHVAPWLMETVRQARLHGLDLPVVYNCGGYESLEMLRLLEGTVDIYMPDAKFLSADLAERYASARDYPDRLRESLREMHRQVGDLQVENGVARRGLMVRHLVMPDAAEDSRRVLEFLAETAPGTAVNVMGQYRPQFRAHECPEIDRPVDQAMVHELQDYAEELGLKPL
jgi:putative pyruvate formate lyase activating enzyme